MSVERIKFEVVVEINYQDKQGRKEAIKKARQCVVASSILSMNGAKPIKAKLIKESK